MDITKERFIRKTQQKQSVFRAKYFSLSKRILVGCLMISCICFAIFIVNTIKHSEYFIHFIGKSFHRHKYDSYFIRKKKFEINLFEEEPISVLLKEIVSKRILELLFFIFLHLIEAFYYKI